MCEEGGREADSVYMYMYLGQLTFLRRESEPSQLVVVFCLALFDVSQSYTSKQTCTCT